MANSIKVVDMLKSKLISSLVVVIIFTIITGCVANEDIKGVTDSWNKVMEKEYQIEKVLVDNAATRSNTLEEWVQNQQNTIA